MSGEKTPNFCPNCGKQIQSEENQYCSYCGHKLNDVNEKNERKNINNKNICKNTDLSKYKKDPAVAAILTFILVCLGQFYNGQILKGIIFVIIFIILFYINGILALLFIIYATYDAYKSAKYINENNENIFLIGR